MRNLTLQLVFFFLLGGKPGWSIGFIHRSVFVSGCKGMHSLRSVFAQLKKIAYFCKNVSYARIKKRPDPLQDHRQLPPQPLPPVDAGGPYRRLYEGRDENVSRRTVQSDIQMMRSDKLGYNAPIVVKEKKYYTYTDPDFSITNVPLTEQDTEMMANAVGVLKQLSGFAAFAGMEDIIGRLEDHVSAVRHEKRPFIYFEKNDELTGLHHITPLYEAIAAEKPLTIVYKSFKQKQADTFVFSAYVLKEFRNRWFVFGRREGRTEVFNLALDRILEISKPEMGVEYVPIGDFNPDTWFDDLIGVTKDQTMKPQRIHFRASPDRAPYIITKPIHKSQILEKKDQDGWCYFQIEVIMNQELERDLLSFGESIEVLSPKSLRDKMAGRLKAACNRYEK